MKIFKAEIEDGLENQIRSSASFSYAASVEPCGGDYKIKKLKSLASYNDSDLYYVQSILVSSNWNKNDDIFDSKEVWAARNTPEDKPTNLEHDEGTIIGHITSNWPITEEGILIDENTPIENLPKKYHILTGSVIYKGFSNPELRDRAEKLILEIESGTKFVSMECFFNGFDYGLIDTITGEYKVLARNDNTAYLTKYLRAYGGSGKHESYKIGRVLRNITFSGKGFVDKPANPESIIFTKDNFDKLLSEKKDDFTNTGVSKSTLTLNAETNIMSLDLDPLMKDVAEMKNKIEAMEIKATEAASEALAALETQNTELKNKIAELTTALEHANLEKEEAAKKKQDEEKIKEEAAKKKDDEEKMKEESMKKIQAELDAANEVIAAYKSKEEEMAKKEKKMKRMASLVEAGFDSDSASSTVDKFESLDDDAFSAMTSLFAGKMPPWLNKKDEETKDEDKSEKNMKEKKKASENTVDTSVLDNVETEENISLSVGGDASSQEETTRAELIEFVCARLGKKLNKGE